MADICTFMVQGTVPTFQNAVRSGNLDDEARAFCHIKLNVKTSQRGDDGKYRTKIIEVSAFRKTAITLAKYATPGKGLILEGDIVESRPVIHNGAELLDAEGRKVYSGPQLVVSPFGVHFQTDYSQSNGNGGAQAAQTAAPAQPAFDPMAGFGSSPAPQTAPAASTAVNASDMDFMSDLPF